MLMPHCSHLYHLKISVTINIYDSVELKIGKKISIIK